MSNTTTKNSRVKKNEPKLKVVTIIYPSTMELCKDIPEHFYFTSLISRNEFHVVIKLLLFTNYYLRDSKLNVHTDRRTS